jgi:hypothetical protein
MFMFYSVLNDFTRRLSADRQAVVGIKCSLTPFAKI